MAVEQCGLGPFTGPLLGHVRSPSGGVAGNHLHCIGIALGELSELAREVTSPVSIRIVRSSTTSNSAAPSARPRDRKVPEAVARRVEPVISKDLN